MDRVNKHIMGQMSRPVCELVEKELLKGRKWRLLAFSSQKPSATGSLQFKLYTLSNIKILDLLKLKAFADYKSNESQMVGFFS